ncbi:rho GTPase-activating protein 26-like isoform X2 [Gigantopelta aegis]|uniref:rho GTPase-activating protein 26-like isoform X2 n=1 Tax=Gigantopelta aegis TaxID=1735272 RepID=UPI001B88C4FD|nr:rho GTPase-activating protein 26-like isoform X2 [Gigantopelta aegis]
MGLQPLEFADCLTDSPYFREKLHEHERELERTSKSIKNLVQHGKQVFDAAKQLSRAQKSFAQDLKDFNFECIGNQQTDDEQCIANSLREFGKLICTIEDERDRLLQMASEQFLKPLENFRKDNIGLAKEGRKVFDKQTAKFCQSLERYLNMKSKVNETTLQEADALLDLERRAFYQASMKYVLQLQEVQEKKKFEFVEILLGFMYSWLTFYHQGHEAAQEFKPYMQDLQWRLQKTRESYQSTSEQAGQLMNKMLEVRGTLWSLEIQATHEVLIENIKPIDQSGTIRGFTRQGYLYLMERKALGTTWTKYYCQYKKETKEFFMILYNQMGGKLNIPEKHILDTCTRRAHDSIEKRFCFDITFKEKPGTMTFQALSEEDRKLWLGAMDGKEPVYLVPKAKTEDTLLDDIGFTFMKKCIMAIEARGLHEQGLYRVVGVNSKVNRLIQMGLDRRKADKLNLDDPAVWETKTITSAVKNYLRSLPEPLMSFKLHESFIKAAKQESKTLRILDIHKLVYELPESFFEMLNLLTEHLHKVASESDKNKMTVGNLGVCFGPTLMRPEEETMAAIMDIKFCNIVVEILINNYEKIFKSDPEDVDPSDSRKAFSRNNAVRSHAVSNNRSDSSSQPMSSSTPVLSRDGGASAAGQLTIYANQAPVHPSAPPSAPPSSGRGKLRPVQIYNPSFETHSNTSSSSDSLNSKPTHQSHLPKMASPKLDGIRRDSNSGITYSNVSVSAMANRFNIGSGADAPTFGSVKKRSSNDYSAPGTPVMNSSLHTSMTGSIGSTSSSTNKPPGRTVRALYQCTAENETELSFEANQLIYNVKHSREPHWLEGSINGRYGLIPENYVEFID